MPTFNALKQQAEDIYKAWLGKKVYFMADSKVICGIITSYDNHQLFVGKEHCLVGDRVFFPTEEALLEHLVSTKVDVTKANKS